jgi:ABC-type antimicrobial peptide transport system permease subunit
VLAIDPALPAYDIAFLADRLGDQEHGSRVLTMLTAVYAGLALLLAALGLFGVLAHAVRRRTQEIGIRMALGGLPRDVLAMVLREGLGLTLVGLACGIAGAILLTRVMSNVLFGVSPSDPGVYAGISALLALVAVAACWIPARRAMRVDPMIALRYE